MTFKRFILLIKYSQEVLSATYLIIVYHVLFINVIKGNIYFSLTSILVFSAFSVNLLILLLIMKQKAIYYEFLFFRLGIVITLMLYMYLFNHICILCVRAHLIVIILTSTILMLELIHKKQIKFKEISDYAK